MRFKTKYSHTALQSLLAAVCVFMLFCVGFFIFRTWHWPLVNDAPQISYLCFLMEHGMAPYRDIIEMNMPGTYLMHIAVMHLLGPGALAWRIFDLCLLLVIAVSMISIAWPYNPAAGIFGACLFALFHGRDGMGETGERDLIIAALLLAGYAFLFLALRKNRAWPMAFFGLCGGYAATIKPIPFLLVISLITAAALTFGKRNKSSLPPILWGLTGMTVSFSIIAAFLVKQHALASFLTHERVMLPFYARTGQLGLGWLLSQSTTSSLSTLALLTLALTLAMRSWQTWEERALLCGIAFGIFSYFSQQKGTLYHRYPMIAFFMLWAGIQFARALQKTGSIRVLGVTAIAFGAVLAPLYAHTAIRRPWSQAFEKSLANDLNALGGDKLSGHIQCMQTSAECDTVLYRMRLVQATGLSYDYFIFGSQEGQVMTESRDRFWKQLQNNPPRIVVVGTGLYPSMRTGYRKLDMWPAFHDFLATHYQLYAEREFPEFEDRAIGYRLYFAKP